MLEYFNNHETFNLPTPMVMLMLLLLLVLGPPSDPVGAPPKAPPPYGSGVVG